MTNEEIESAFDEAQKRWLDEHKGRTPSTAEQRYFFFAGSEFGLGAAKGIYAEAHGLNSETEVALGGESVR